MVVVGPDVQMKNNEPKIIAFITARRMLPKQLVKQGQTTTINNETVEDQEGDAEDWRGKGSRREVTAARRRMGLPGPLRRLRRIAVDTAIRTEAMEDQRRWLGAGYGGGARQDEGSPGPQGRQEVAALLGEEISILWR